MTETSTQKSGNLGVDGPKVVVDPVVGWDSGSYSPSYWPSNHPYVEISLEATPASYSDRVIVIFKLALGIFSVAVLMFVANVVVWTNPYLFAVSVTMLGLAAAFARAAFIQADKEDRGRTAS